MSKPNSLSAKRPGGKIEKTAKTTIDQITEKEPLEKLQIQVPASMHRKLKNLANTTKEKMKMRHLGIEAIEDLFKKYEKGEGNYETLDI